MANSKPTYVSSRTLADEQEAQRREFRRERLIALIDDHFCGRGSHLSQKTGLNPALVSQFRNGKRAMTNRTVDMIEMATEKPGWFGEDDQLDALPYCTYPSAETELEAKMLLVYRKLDDKDQRRLLADVVYKVTLAEIEQDGSSSQIDERKVG